MNLLSSLFKKAGTPESDRGGIARPSLSAVLSAPPLRILPRGAPGAPDYQVPIMRETAGERVQRLIKEFAIKQAVMLADPERAAVGIAFPEDGKGTEDLAEAPEVRENTAVGEPVVEFRPAMAVKPEEWDKRPAMPSVIYGKFAAAHAGEVETLRARCEELENRLRWSHQREVKLRAEVEAALASNRGWREANWRLMQKIESLKGDIHLHQHWKATDSELKGAIFGPDSWLPRIPVGDYFRAWLFRALNDQVWTVTADYVMMQIMAGWLPPGMISQIRASDVSRWLGKMAIEFPEVVGRCRAKNGARQWRLDGTKIPVGGLDAWMERRAEG